MALLFIRTLAMIGANADSMFARGWGPDRTAARLA
jgi:hypothetical protein